MRTTLVLGVLSVACVSRAPTVEESIDSAVADPAPGFEPDLKQAQFFARTQGSPEPLPLLVESFAVQVHTGPQAVRTHLSITMNNPGKTQVEAVMRLPIPPGAAVTRAVLWVGKTPMEGAFVARDRARDIYRSITERRRDPALVTWSSPEWIEATVFPVEGNDRRMLELEWIEPVATSADHQKIWYRIPVLAHDGQQVTRPDSLTVDGLTRSRQGRTWLALPASQITGAAAVARQPGDPFGYVFSPARTEEASASSVPTRIVVVAETSGTMSHEHRKLQSRALTELLAELPASAELDLLAVDWRVRPLAEAASPSVVRETLDALDAIPSAGALDLQNALLTASDRASLRRASRIVFVGRGLDAFAGDATAAPLARMQAADQMLIVVGADGAPILDVAALTGGQSLAYSEVVQLARLLSVIRRARPSLAIDSAETFFPLETVTGQTRWMARFVGESPPGAIRGAERDLEALWIRAHVVKLQRGTPTWVRSTMC